MFLMSIGVMSVPVFSLMGFNYYIDPYWNFGHAHDNNDYQSGFDERLQKTNILASNPPDFDSLLVGTSRVTYMNTNEFRNEKVFNYGLSSMHLDEYGAYIAYARETKGRALDKIYMELPYNSFDGDLSLPMEPPEVFFEQAEDRFLDVSSLFSKDTFEKSLVNYEASKNDYYDKQRAYTRDNQVTTTYPSKIVEARRSVKESFDKEGYTREFPYKEDYKEILMDIQRDNPGTQIIPFTDLAHVDRLKIYLKNPNYFEAYERAIREIIEVYGSMVTFHLENEVTVNDRYWLDFAHYYPKVGDILIEALETGKGEGEIFWYLNKDNVDTYFEDLKVIVEKPLELP